MTTAEYVVAQKTTKVRWYNASFVRLQATTLSNKKMLEEGLLKTSEDKRQGQQPHDASAF